MQSAAYTNKYGQSVLFSKEPPFFLYGIDATSLSTSRGTQKAIGQDGETSQSVTYDTRTVILRCGVCGRTGNTMDWKRMYQNWQEICRVIIPQEEGTLIYKNDAGVYQISCYPTELPNFDRVMGTYHKFSLDFIADIPFWLSQFEFQNRLGQVVGGKRYPLKYPLRFGVWVKDATVLNDTNVKTPVIIEISSTAQYITVTNETTGERLKIDQAIEANQKMVIDTQNCTVKLITYDEMGKEVSESYANYKLDLSSRYFQLIPGENRITIDNGYPGMMSTAVIRYHKRFLGV